MEDFLTRLSERAVGRAPVVQPLIPSLFTTESTGRSMRSALEGKSAPPPDDPDQRPYHRNRETPRVSDAPRLVPSAAATRDEDRDTSVTPVPSEAPDGSPLAPQPPTEAEFSVYGPTSGQDAAPGRPSSRLMARSPEEPGALETRSESGDEGQENASSTVSGPVRGAPDSDPRLSRSGELEREAAHQRKPRNTSQATADGPIPSIEPRLERPHRVEPAPLRRGMETAPKPLIPEGSPLDVLAAEDGPNQVMLRSSTTLAERGWDTAVAPAPPLGTEVPPRADEDAPRSKTVPAQHVAPTIVPRIVHQPDQRRERDLREPRVPAPESPAPTIRVAIGRIEVCAIMPPPAAPARQKTPARPGPLLSLDDYLKQRNGGQR